MRRSAPRFVAGFLVTLLQAGVAGAEPEAVLQLPSLVPIQEIVVPAVARALGVERRELSPKTVAEHVFLLPHAGRVTGVNPKDCIGVRFAAALARRKVEAGTSYPFIPKVSYEGSELVFPVRADTFRLSVAGSSPLRLTAEVQAPRAQLASGIKLTTDEQAFGQCRTKLWDTDPLKDLANETRAFNFELSGLRGNMTARLSAPSGRLTVDQVDKVEARLGQVAVRECKDLDALVRWVNDTFDQRLRTCTEEITAGVNDVLTGKHGEAFGAKALVQSVVGESLEIFDLGTPQRIDPSGAMPPLATSVSLAALAPKGGGLLARWRVGVSATRTVPDAELPPFSAVTRPGLDEPISGTPPRGDLVLSLPLDLLDRLLYESLRAGLFASALTVPAVAPGAACPVTGSAGIGRGFPLTVALLRAPIAQRGAGERVLQLEAPARLRATDPTRDGLELDTTLRIAFRLEAGEGGLLRARPDGVQLADTRGALRVCGAKLPLSERETSVLTRVLSERVRSQLGDGYVLRAAVPLPGGVKLALTSLAVGSAHVTAAFAIQKP